MQYRAVRAISSDRLRVVSGSDDMRVLVWDKNSKQLLEELKGHEGKVHIRMFARSVYQFAIWSCYQVYKASDLYGQHSCE